MSLSLLPSQTQHVLLVPLQVFLLAPHTPVLARLRCWAVLLLRELFFFLGKVVSPGGGISGTLRHNM